MTAVDSAANRDQVRRLVLVVGAVVFLDTLFYSVVSPLLPALSGQLHLSKFSAGVLTGSYAAGTLLASIPGGILAARLGPRFTVCTGLTLMVISTLGFAWLNTGAGLDMARFVEGVGGACSWAGGLAWIVSEARPGERGEMVGKALGWAIGGALFGPAVGALANVVGRSLTFTVVAGLGGVLVVVAARTPHVGEVSGQGLRVLWRAVRQPMFAVALWLMTVPAVISGLLALLGPLRLHQFGASSLLIAGVYALSAAVEGLLSPLIGKLSDRRGRLLPLRLALVIAAVLLSVFTLPQELLWLAPLVLVSTLMLSMFWAPAMALISDVAESDGVDQALAAALMNLGWAGGQIVGAVAGGAMAKAYGDALPTAITAAICLLTLVALRNRRLARAINGVQGARAPAPV